MSTYPSPLFNSTIAQTSPQGRPTGRGDAWPKIKVKEVDIFSPAFWMLYLCSPSVTVFAKLQILHLLVCSTSAIDNVMKSEMAAGVCDQPQINKQGQTWITTTNWISFIKERKNVMVKKLRGSKWCKCIRLGGVISGPMNATEAKWRTVMARRDPTDHRSSSSSGRGTASAWWVNMISSG